MSSFYTLTYSEAVKGWPSFYSFNPDMMIGMNQYFYTFKKGNLYEHNTSVLRNTFYGIYTPSMIKSVFNEVPIENKVFKTLILEGDSGWAAQLVTDIQNSGFVESGWFEKKEGTLFAFIRNSGNSGAVSTSPGEYPLRSANGIGVTTAVLGTTNNPILRFDTNVRIGSILNIGDLVYFALPPNLDNPQLAGRLITKNINPQTGQNELVLDATLGGAIAPIPSQTAFFLAIKDSVAESHGVLGHYCVFELTNDLTTPTELFVVKSNIMKSFP